MGSILEGEGTAPITRHFDEIATGAAASLTVMPVLLWAAETRTQGNQIRARHNGPEGLGNDGWSGTSEPLEAA